MNKKVLVIGIMTLIVVGLVTAATVKYLSNSAELELSVETPMSVIFQETGTDAYDLGAMYGGETAVFTTVATNNANVGIDTYKATFEVTAPGNFDGTEFDSVNLVDRGTDMGDILAGLCFVRTDGTFDNFANIATEATNVAKLMACSDGSTVDGKYTHPSGSVIDNVISIKLSAGLQPGDYSVSVCHLDDLTGVC